MSVISFLSSTVASVVFENSNLTINHFSPCNGIILMALKFDFFLTFILYHGKEGITLLSGQETCTMEKACPSAVEPCTGDVYLDISGLNRDLKNTLSVFSRYIWVSG
ncbi:UNVERIFIED_CONTAM: hypothetical protein K2H54_032808 [Gekko kuhli]